MNQVLGGLDRILARAGKRIVHFDEQGDSIAVDVSSKVRTAPCPVCRWSSRRHGSYVRHLEERPMLELRVVLDVEMHRFKPERRLSPADIRREHQLTGRTPSASYMLPSSSFAGTGPLAVKWCGHD